EPIQELEQEAQGLTVLRPVLRAETLAIHDLVGILRDTEVFSLVGATVLTRYSGHDRVEPGPQRSAPLELREAAQDHQEHILRCVTEPGFRHAEPTQISPDESKLSLVDDLERRGRRCGRRDVRDHVRRWVESRCACHWACSRGRRRDQQNLPTTY